MSNTFALAFCVAFAALVGCQRPVKVGTVDTEALFLAHPQHDAVEREINRRRDLLRTQMSEKLSKMESLADEVHARVADKSMTSELGERLKAEQMELAEEMPAFRTREEQALREYGGHERERLLGDINAAIKAVATESDLDLVVDGSACSLNGTTVVIASKPSDDITQRVVAILRRPKTAR